MIEPGKRNNLFKCLFEDNCPIKKQKLIVLTQEEYTKLINDYVLLDCLKMSGVEEWQHYNQAVKFFQSDGK